MEPGTFTCSICGDESRNICVYCTKDACGNHLCERCRRCSDCCECGVPVGQTGDERAEPASESEFATPSLSSQAEDVPFFPTQYDNS